MEKKNIEVILKNIKNQELMVDKNCFKKNVEIPMIYPNLKLPSFRRYY